MIGGFEVVSRLSEGASAEVLLARAEETSERVILEVIRPELFRQRDLTSRFLDEAKVRKALSHPNVARRVGEGTAKDGRPFLVSEALGDSLADLLRARGPLEVEALIKLVIPLCDALQFLHERGMVHGNLNPGSVYLGADGLPQRPKLLDYGLALFRPGRTLPKPKGRVLVEPEYLSPERIRGQRGGPAADVYALGVLMFEALTGAPPFTGDAVDVRHRHLTALPEPLPSHCARVAKVVERCLAKDPTLRYPAARDVRDALASELEGTLPLPPPRNVLAQAARPEPGDAVGRYTLIEPIGEGAMGRVFLARHTRLGRVVALKLLKPEHAELRDQVERFVREARAVNRIRNEHIVEIFDLVDEPAGRGGRRVYCVMELLRGSSLGDQLQKGPFPLLRGLRILRQVAHALDAAHRAGVVHRDIKPDNIFLTRRDGGDFVKVVDFGVAKLREGHDPIPPLGPPPSILGETAAGTVVGTPAFMSPEQVTGRSLDHRADIYALGTVLYRLLSGRNPFTGADFEDLAKKIARVPPLPLPDRAPCGTGIPGGLRTLVRECLQKEPGLRPHSMAEVAARLSRIIDELERGVPEAPPPPSAPAWRLAVKSLTSLARPKVALHVDSEPQGARITRVDTGQPLGMTPARVRVDRAKGKVRLRLQAPGHHPAEVEAPRDRDGSVTVVLRPL